MANQNQLEISQEQTGNENGNKKPSDNTFEKFKAGDTSDEDEDDIPAESKISKTLSDQTTKTVVILVLMLLFMLAGCSIESYVDTTMIHEQGLKNLVYLYDLGPSHWEEYKTSYFHYRKITRE